MVGKPRRPNFFQLLYLISAPNREPEYNRATKHVSMRSMSSCTASYPQRPGFSLCLRGQSTLLWTLGFQTSSILRFMGLPDGERRRQRCPLQPVLRAKGDGTPEGQASHWRGAATLTEGPTRHSLQLLHLPHLPHPRLEFKSRQ